MNPYPKNTKLCELFKQIEDDKKLTSFLIKNTKIEFMSYNDNEDFSSEGFNHLHKCIIKTRKYSFLNKYIDEYLKLYPKKSISKIKQQNLLH